MDQDSICRMDGHWIRQVPDSLHCDPGPSHGIANKYEKQCHLFEFKIHTYQYEPELVFSQPGFNSHI